jgi:hypothetical protein
MNGQNLNHEKHFLHALQGDHEYGITVFNDKTIIYKVEGDKIHMHVEYEPWVKEMVSQDFYKQHIKFIL